MCQDAILHEQYFDEEIKGKLILSKNSSTSNQSKPEVNSWVVLCRILSFFGQVSLLRLQILITELFCNTSNTNLAGIPTKVLPN